MWECGCFTFARYRNCRGSAQLGSSGLYLLPLQSRWRKWHVISPLMTAGVTRSPLWTKQFSIMKKTGYLANLVPLQRDLRRWVRRLVWTPLNDLRSGSIIDLYVNATPAQPLTNTNWQAIWRPPFPSLHMYLFQQLLFSCCLLLSEAVHWCASITGTFLTRC